MLVNIKEIKKLLERFEIQLNDQDIQLCFNTDKLAEINNIYPKPSYFACIGDRVLDFVLYDNIHNYFDIEMSAGALSSIRNKYCSNANLDRLVNKLEISKYLSINYTLSQEETATIFESLIYFISKNYNLSKVDKFLSDIGFYKNYIEINAREIVSQKEVILMASQVKKYILNLLVDIKKSNHDYFMEEFYLAYNYFIVFVNSYFAFKNPHLIEEFDEIDSIKEAANDFGIPRNKIRNKIVYKIKPIIEMKFEIEKEINKNKTRVYYEIDKETTIKYIEDNLLKFLDYIK